MIGGKRGAATILVLLLVVLTHSAALAQTPSPTIDLLANAPRGSITGQVRNGTAAAPSLGSLQISLFISGLEGIADTLQTTSAPNGTFRFDDVPMVAGYEYVTAVIYRDRTFSSAFTTLEEGLQTLDLPIATFELTEDPSVLSITEMQIQGKVVGETLEVRQLVRFRNSSDRLFTTTQDMGDGRFASVLISLPPGAQVVSFDSPSRYIVFQQDFTILDTAPVLPGEGHIIVVVYILPYDGNAALIEQPLQYPFDGEARLLITPSTIRVNSQQFSRTGEEQLGDQTYQIYAATLQVEAGGTIRYEISGSATDTGASTTSVENNSIILALTALIGLLILGVAALFVVRGKQQMRPENMIDLLSQQLDRLDDKHKRGEIPHDLWHKQRAPIQARLDELMNENSNK